MMRTVASRPILVKLMNARFAFGTGEKNITVTHDEWVSQPENIWHTVVRLILLQHNAFQGDKKKCRFLSALWHCGVPLQSRSAAHLYSQKASSFILCDSVSGWRSSFSFTAGSGRRDISAPLLKSSTFIHRCNCILFALSGHKIICNASNSNNYVGSRL